MFNWNLSGSVDFAQIQGDRETQEDRIVHVYHRKNRKEQGHLLVVLDGHGGSEVSGFCSNSILLWLKSYEEKREERELGVSKGRFFKFCFFQRGILNFTFP